MRTCGIYRVLAATIALAALLAPGVAAQLPAQPVLVYVGHILGGTETQFVERLMAKVSESLKPAFPLARIYVDIQYTDSYCCVKDRFRGRVPMTDVVFVYAGQTAQLSEIYQLAREDRLLPLEDVTDVRDLRLDDVYPNLLAPVKYFGRTWAVPVRVCPPCLALAKTRAAAPAAWDDLAREGVRLSIPTKPEQYLFWRTLVEQRNGLSMGETGFTWDETKVAETLRLTEALTDAAAPVQENPLGGIVFPDGIINNLRLRRDFAFYPYPVGESDVVYCQENTWYVAVNSNITEEKKPIIGAILQELLKDDIQMFVATLAFSPPVRPSLARSARFNELFGDDAPQKVFSAMVPRLRFRNPQHKRDAAEQCLEERFLRIMETGDTAPGLLSKALTDANEQL